MPLYDFVCTDTEACGKVTEQVVPSFRTETITCPACGAEAKKAPDGYVDGKKRHVGVYFNWMAED